MEPKNPFDKAGKAVEIGLSCLFPPVALGPGYDYTVKIRVVFIGTN